MLREATYPPAAVNVLDVSSESMAAFQVFLYGRFWVFTEVSSYASICGDIFISWGSIKGNVKEKNLSLAGRREIFPTFSPTACTHVGRG